MKNMYLTVAAFALIGICQAQFSLQNCVGSNCNSNNFFGLKRREVLEEILAEVEEEENAQEHEAVVAREKRQAAQNCVGSNCNQNNLGLGGFGFPGFPSFPAPAPASEIAVQNCVGSNCGQNNNFGKKKREISDLVNSLTQEVLEAEDREHREDITREKRQAAQNCVGSNCNQNNFGLGGFGFPGFPFPAPAPATQGVAVQNCVGSNCGQNNNFGRKKREISELVDTLTQEVLEAEAQEQVTKEVDEDHSSTRSKRDLVVALLEELL